MAIKFERVTALGTLSLTPLIDVVFLLLIFFLVATRFEDEEREMNVVLPQASEAVPLVSRPKEFVVNVDRAGRMIVNRQQVSRAELLAALEQAHASNPLQQTVIIRADRRCIWQNVMTVMDLCNQANILDYRVTAADEGS